MPPKTNPFDVLHKSFQDAGTAIEQAIRDILAEVRGISSAAGHLPKRTCMRPACDRHQSQLIRCNSTSNGIRCVNHVHKHLGCAYIKAGEFDPRTWTCDKSREAARAVEKAKFEKEKVEAEKQIVKGNGKLDRKNKEKLEKQLKIDLAKLKAEISEKWKHKFEDGTEGKANVGQEKFAQSENDDNSDKEDDGEKDDETEPQKHQSNAKPAEKAKQNIAGKIRTERSLQRTAMIRNASQEDEDFLDDNADKNTIDSDDEDEDENYKRRKCCSKNCKIPDTPMLYGSEEDFTPEGDTFWEISASRCSRRPKGSKHQCQNAVHRICGPGISTTARKNSDWVCTLVVRGGRCDYRSGAAVKRSRIEVDFVRNHCSHLLTDDSDEDSMKSFESACDAIEEEGREEGQQPDVISLTDSDDATRSQNAPIEVELGSSPMPSSPPAKRTSEEPPEENRASKRARTAMPDEGNEDYYSDSPMSSVGESVLTQGEEQQHIKEDQEGEQDCDKFPQCAITRNKSGAMVERRTSNDQR